MLKQPLEEEGGGRFIIVGFFYLNWDDSHISQQTDVYLLICLYIWIFKPGVTLL